MRPFQWLGFLMIVATAVPGQATTVDAPTLRQMTDRADRIFVGEVVDVRAYRSGSSIHTDVTFRTAETVKGRSSPTVLLTFLGGTVGDDTLEVTGMPRFVAGDEQVVFALDGERHMSPIVGLWHGRVRVSRDPVTRAARVLRNDGTPFERATAVSERPVEVSSRLIVPMRLEAFLDEVKRLVQAGGAR